MLKTTINLTFGESSLLKWIINGGVGECCGGGGGGGGGEGGEQIFSYYGGLLEALPEVSDFFEGLRSLARAVTHLIF